MFGFRLSGSRIGVLFVPTKHDINRAQMHFIINGYDQGPCTQDIPYKEGALHAVVDVYGTTKQVRVIQLYDSKWVLVVVGRLVGWWATWWFICDCVPQFPR